MQTSVDLTVSFYFPLGGMLNIAYGHRRTDFSAATKWNPVNLMQFGWYFNTEYNDGKQNSCADRAKLIYIQKTETKQDNSFFPLFVNGVHKNNLHLMCNSALPIAHLNIGYY